jgi:muconolactone delta-isomerase
MEKIELLDTMRDRRAAWDALIAQADGERMTRPGVAGEWSVKDIVAHVTWAESETAQILQPRGSVGSQLWELPEDERNAVVFELNRDRPLSEVLAESAEVFRRLLDAVQALSQEDLNDAARFQDMPLSEIPWRIVVANSFAHYYQHMPAIRAWLDRPSEDADSP